MILTKTQRLEAYTYAMLMVLAVDFSGRKSINPFVGYPWVCNNLNHWLSQMGREMPGREILFIFPEFEVQRPREILDQWWPITKSGNAKRLAAIERAIELTEKM